MPAGHHVVDVVAGPAVRAARRERPVRGRQGAAAGTDQPGLDGGRRGVPPVSCAGAHDVAPMIAGGRPAVTRAVRDLRVELVDQLVPAAHDLAGRRPERLVAPGLELLDRHALLLHPGEVAEVEDPVALGARRLEDVVLGDGGQPRPERLAGGHGVEPGREVAGDDPLQLRPVQLGAVGGDGQDHVVRPQPLVAGDLDGGEHVADRRQAEGPERRHGLRGHAAPPDQVLAADGRVEQDQQLHPWRGRRSRRRGRWPSRCGSAGCACRRCPGCCARRSRWPASSGTRAASTATVREPSRSLR